MLPRKVLKTLTHCTLQNFTALLLYNLYVEKQPSVECWQKLHLLHKWVQEVHFALLMW